MHLKGEEKVGIYSGYDNDMATDIHTPVKAILLFNGAHVGILEFTHNKEKRERD